MIETLNTVVLAIVFLIPGFIIDSLLVAGFPTAKRDATFTFFRFLCLSAFNYCLWTFKIVYIYYNYKTISSNWLASFAVYVIFLQPLLIGCICLWCGKRGVLIKFGFDTPYLAPTAWDFTFYNCETRFAIITLVDNTRVYCLIDNNSYIPSFKDGNDLFVSKCYNLDAVTLDWKERDRTCGMLICQNQIKKIEFIKEEDKDAQSTET